MRDAAAARHVALFQPSHFEAIPGHGVRARLDGHTITVGNRRLVTAAALVDHLEPQGTTLLFVARDGELIGAIETADTVRPEAPAALAQVRALGIQQIELLTGDTDATAAALAQTLGISYRASLLPEDKIAIVKEYQARGHTVVMIGAGVNDAPALAQANVGVVMGVVGSDIALEAAHVALMQDDWLLVPELFRIAQRTMRVVKINLGFAAVYNVVGISLAALGILPPILAAAAQSLPDLGIMANSARLLRQPKSARQRKGRK